MAAESIIVDELDDLEDIMDDIIDPKGDDKFVERVANEMMHPKNYLAWFRSTQVEFQYQVVALLERPEDWSAKHAFLTEMSNVIEAQLEILESGEQPEKRQKLQGPPPLQRTCTMSANSAEEYSPNARP
jgi:hypothetical protein